MTLYEEYLFLGPLKNSKNEICVCVLEKGAVGINFGAAVTHLSNSAH